MRDLALRRAAVLFTAALATTTLAPLGAALAAGLEPETVLYSFCAKGGKTCTDGAQPGPAALVSDAAGRLYGTTQAGGAHGKGTVFELSPNAAKTKWTETVLYSFCAQGGTSCTDGSVPVAGLIIDKAGRLYGSAANGGAHRDGVVFTLTPNAAKTKWIETILYSFGSQSGDGASPAAGLIADATGHLYGTTYAGGAHSGGTDTN